MGVVPLVTASTDRENYYHNQRDDGHHEHGPDDSQFDGANSEE